MKLRVDVDCRARAVPEVLRNLFLPCRCLETRLYQRQSGSRVAKKQEGVQLCRTNVGSELNSLRSPLGSEKPESWWS